jgi:transposase InsO family protein
MGGTDQQQSHVFSYISPSAASAQRPSTAAQVAALERTVADRQPQAGLVHHPDRGLPYASPEYVAALEKYGMVARMS